MQPDGTRHITFWVPGPPVPCARPRVVHGKGGKPRAHTEPRTKEFKDRVRVCAMTAANSKKWKIVPGDKYWLNVDVYREASRGDWDNYAKGIADAMNGILYPDDRLIIEAHVRLFVDKQRPRVRVIVGECDEGQEVAA